MYRCVIIFPDGKRFPSKWLESRAEAKRIRRLAMVLVCGKDCTIEIEKAERGDI